jgi:hypothetical protein
MLAWAMLSIVFGFLATAFLMAAPVIQPEDYDANSKVLTDYISRPEIKKT